MVVVSSCSQQPPDNLVPVKGGSFKSITIPDFYIGAYEVTQKEWIAVMGTNPSHFTGANLPVETVSWYDCIEYCNKRSASEGLQPYYIIDRNTKDPDNTNDLDN